ncbi:unnamed protein product, partial [Timema podura]|nr:unnamed protein product [Timema podura]
WRCSRGATCFQRAFGLGVNLCPLVSRVPLATRDSFMMDSQEEGEMKVAGRVVLNVWRLMRNEVSLMSYTFENVMYHVMHQRVALHSFQESLPLVGAPDSAIQELENSSLHLHKWITAEHYLTRVDGLVKLLDQLDLIARTSELARLFGIQFYEVLSRGSQGLLNLNYHEGFLNLNYPEGLLNLNYLEGLLNLNYPEGLLNLNYHEGFLNINYPEGLLNLNYLKGLLNLNYPEGLLNLNYHEGFLNINYPEGLLIINYPW